MIRIVLLAVFSGLLIACDPDRSSNRHNSELDFSTTDDAEIYFKNVRRPYYEHEDMPAAKLDIYRLKQRSQTNDYPVLNLAIAHNWRHDEAYLLIEPNAAVGSAPPLHIQWQSVQDSTKTGTYLWEERDKKAQLTFVGQIYTSLRNKHKLFLITNDSLAVPLLSKGNDREAFRRTVFDYYKLTGAFK